MTSQYVTMECLFCSVCHRLISLLSYTPLNLIPRLGLRWAQGSKMVPSKSRPTFQFDLYAVNTINLSCTASLTDGRTDIVLVAIGGTPSTFHQKSSRPWSISSPTGIFHLILLLNVLNSLNHLRIESSRNPLKWPNEANLIVSDVYCNRIVINYSWLIFLITRVSLCGEEIYGLWAVCFKSLY